MTAKIPTIIIIQEADIPVWDQIGAAMGFGSGFDQFRTVCAQGDETYTVTHRLTHASNFPEAEESTWRRMASAQDLPPLVNGSVWGEDGVIDAATAQDAMTRLLVFSCAGSTDSITFCEGALHGLGLRYTPDPEL